jgi:imidazolonepropionase-like amidohydrolase
MKIYNRVFYTICLVMFSGFVFSQQVPGKEQSKSILISNGILHVGNGELLENAFVGFENGKINYVSNKLPEKEYEINIDATNKHIYPGFIALNTSLGLGEIDAVRATIDEDEIGDFLPHVRSIIAYNAESKVVETMRMNGVLLSQVAPNGGIISGSSSVVQLDAWNWEDAVISYDQGIHLNWPSPYSRSGYSYYRGPSIIKKSDKYESNIEEIKNFFDSSKAYLNEPNPNPVSLPYKAMSSVFSGRSTVFLHANYEKQIKDGVNFLQEQKIKNIVVVGGTNSLQAGDFLANNNIKIALEQPHNLPSMEDEDVKSRFKLASQLIDKGVTVALDPTGEMTRMNTRNLPFFAGSFAAYGVNKEKAVETITLNAAKVLGIEDSYGSIELGKSATLFISLGDALDMRTNSLSHAYIDGREISLETNQTKLWKRYKKKVEEEKSN